MLYFTDQKISYPLAFAISGVLISTIAHNIIFQISSSIANFTSLFGVLIFFCAFAYYRITLFPPLDNSTRVIFYLLIIYILSVLLRWGDAPITKVTIIRIVTDKYGVMGFLTPLIVFLGSKRINIQTIFRLSYISSLIGILFYSIQFQRDISNFTYVSINRSLERYKGRCQYGTGSWVFHTTECLLGNVIQVCSTQIH